MRQKRVTTDPPRSLREWREREAMTQEQAADRLHLSYSYYTKLERGVRGASGTTAKAIHLETHVPIPVLVGAA